MKCVLVVGGTGMLGSMCASLVLRGIDLTVISRGQIRPTWLGHESVEVIAQDYRDTARLRALIGASIRERGSFDAAVCWIHASAPEAPIAVAELVAPCRYLHVLGSAGADPARDDGARRETFEAVRGLRYQEVILGFEIEGGSARWLRDAEISAGVLGAVDSGAPRTIVGAVRPWSARP